MKFILVTAAVIAGCGIARAEATTSNDQPLLAKTLRIKLQCKRTDTVDAIVTLFRRQIEQRCEARVKTSGLAEFNIELALAAGIGKEGFKIEDGSAGAVRIVGNDTRGLLYGVGKFLRTSRYDRGGFTPSPWRGMSVPQKEVRGMYISTHFHNFYHDAPVAELEHYVEDIILWGVNNVAVWYDMHHFNGFDDPRAAELRDRIRHIGQVAARLGVDVGLAVIANEGYGNSPPAMQRDGTGMRTRCFPTDVCPSKPGAMEYTVDNLRQFLDAMPEFKPTQLIVFAYDSGGCNCPKCRPWVTNGYPKAAGRLVRMVKEKYPATKAVLVTWAMTPKEMTDLNQAMVTKPADWEWADSVLPTLYVSTGTKPSQPSYNNSHLSAVTTNRPLLVLPRSGTHDMRPWGGFGANPSPEGCQTAWNVVKQRAHGGWPYSEVIADDMNKAIFTQFYWSPDRPVSEIVHEYIAFEYSPEVVEEVCGAIRTLETNHTQLRWVNGMLVNGSGAKPAPRDPATDAAYETLKRVDAKLPTYARHSWRWRILYLRALLDSELRNNGGKATKSCEAAFHELTEIYHAQKAEFAAKMPDPGKPSSKPLPDAP